MESIPKNDCQKIGYLQKPHGVRGEMVLQLEDDYTESLEAYPTIFLEIDGLLVPFFLTKDGIRSRSAEAVLVKLDWIDSEEIARKFCGSSAYLLNSDLIFEEDEMTLHHLIGFTLIDSLKGKIGEIEQVDDYAGNLLLTVHFEGQEVLIPFNEDFLIRFDEDQKEIELQCPDGIFDDL
ncbi:ribosome maturation factor RimM [Sunxiuqinia sp. A32]|uniref:ribosome maturation factor RimM n=1 Tax=Sunxiuqinia sp. A32 TaxID=3461496 RepID=UPI004045A1E5